MVEQVVRARCSWWPWTLCWCSTSCSCFSCSSSGSPASCTTCRVLGRMLSHRTRSSRRERRRAMMHRSTMYKVGIKMHTIGNRLICEASQPMRYRQPCYRHWFCSSWWIADEPARFWKIDLPHWTELFRYRHHILGICLSIKLFDWCLRFENAVVACIVLIWLRTRIGTSCVIIHRAVWIGALIKSREIKMAPCRSTLIVR